MSICAYNNSGTVVRLIVVNNNTDANKKTDYYSAQLTKCIKMSDVPVNVGDSYNLYYNVQYDGNNKLTCAKDKTRTSSDSGKTKKYTIYGAVYNNVCEQ